MAMVIETLSVVVKANASQFRTEMGAVIALSRRTANEMRLMASAVQHANAALRQSSQAARQISASLAALTSQTRASVTAQNNQNAAAQRNVVILRAQVAAANALALALARAAAVPQPRFTPPPGGGGGGGRRGLGLPGVGGIGSTALRYGRRAALGAAGIGVASLASFAGIDDSIRRAQAVAGESSDALRKQMMENAKQIGSTTLTSAADVARAYTEMAQAGISLVGSQQKMYDISRFSVAANISTAKSVELLAQATSALGLSGAADFGKVSNAIVKAANLTTSSAEDIGSALTTKSAAAAKMVGKDLHEVIALISAFAKVGVVGQGAGEKIHMFLRDAQTAALKHKDAWSALGLAVYDGSGRMLHSADIVAQLERKFAGLSDATKKQTMLALGFSDRSSAATMQLLGLSDTIRGFESSTRAATSETERLANVFESSLLAQARILWNQIKVLGSEIGERLAPYARVAMHYISGLAKSISDSIKVANDSEAIRKLSTEFEKAAKVGGAMFGELVIYARETFLPQLSLVAIEAGAAFADGFKSGFSGAGKDRSFWEAELSAAQKSLTMAGTNPISVSAAQERIAIANAKLGNNPGGTIQERLAKIVADNYGKVSTPIRTNAPTFDSYARFGTPKPQAPGKPSGNLSDLAGDGVDDILHDLSNDGKSEKRVADRLKEQLEREAKHIHEALRNPTERMKDELDHANDLLRAGVLSAQDFGRLKDKLVSELDNATKTKTSATKGTVDRSIIAAVPELIMMRQREVMRVEHYRKMAAYRRAGSPGSYGVDDRPVRPKSGLEVAAEHGRVIRPWTPDANPTRKPMHPDMVRAGADIATADREGRDRELRMLEALNKIADNSKADTTTVKLTPANIS